MPIDPPIWNSAVLAFALTAAIGDLRRRKIPRVLTMTGLVAGLAFHAVRHEFASAGGAALLAMVAGLIFFRLGAIGGGDVKLMMALGAMLGLSRWLFAMEVAVLVAGLLAFGQTLYRGRIAETLTNIGATLRWLAKNRLRPHPVINVGNAAMLRAPFAVAAAVGALAAVVKP